MRASTAGPASCRRSPRAVHAASANSKTPSRTGYGFNSCSWPVNIKAGQVRFKKIRQLITLDALGKTGIVFHGLSLQNLTTRCQLLGHKHRAT